MFTLMLKTKFTRAARKTSFLYITDNVLRKVFTYSFISKKLIVLKAHSVPDSVLKFGDQKSPFQIHGINTAYH